MLRGNPIEIDGSRVEGGGQVLRSALSLSGGGRFTTTAPTPHTVTNTGVIQRFLPVSIDWEETGDGVWTVTVAR